MPTAGSQGSDKVFVNAYSKLGNAIAGGFRADLNRRGNHDHEIRSSGGLGFGRFLVTTHGPGDHDFIRVHEVSASGGAPLNANIVSPTFTGTGLQAVQIQGLL